MTTGAEKVQTWRNKTKQRMIDAMGGKCVCCGYSKCNRALEFHHIDSSLKSFTISSAIANATSWKIVVEELKKCVLVCSNCHKEIESGLVTVPAVVPAFDAAYENYWLNYGNTHQVTKNGIRYRERKSRATLRFRALRTREFPNCIVCGILLSGKHKRKYCSRECFAKTRLTQPPVSKEILWDDVTRKSLEEIGRKYGVTGAAIKKWLKKYGLPCRAKDIIKVKYGKSSEGCAESTC